MITANELRVGNLIQERDGFIMSVVSIHDDNTIYCDFEGNEGDVWEFDDKNPSYGVKLTEEILLRCGFEKIDGWYCKGRLMLFRINNYFTSRRSSERDLVEVDLVNLHQLQNLYFALTGKELEVKL